MTRPGRLLIASLALVVSVAKAAEVDEAPVGAVVERHLSDDDGFTRWVQDPDRIDTDMGDALETRETVTDALETVKLSNLVPPIGFESGVAQIPVSTVDSLNDILKRMRDRINVRLHLVGDRKSVV